VHLGSVLSSSADCQSSAQAALALDGVELEHGLPLSVKISEPAKRQERTDARADARELYVSGLSKFVNEKNLRDLFEPVRIRALWCDAFLVLVGDVLTSFFGRVSTVLWLLYDWSWTMQGNAKGSRLSSLRPRQVQETYRDGLPSSVVLPRDCSQSSAQAALAVNNQELKKRTIGVTLADPRKKCVSGRVWFCSRVLISAWNCRNRPTKGAFNDPEARERSVRVRNLPPDVQEAIVWQTFEPYGKIKQVLLNKNKNEATVEFEHQAVSSAPPGPSQLTCGKGCVCVRDG
jgi:RNA recognition motif-containing protein